MLCFHTDPSVTMNSSLHTLSPIPVVHVYILLRTLMPVATVFSVPNMIVIQTRGGREELRAPGSGMGSVSSNVYVYYINHLCK